jgi:ethanolamine permease
VGGGAAAIGKSGAPLTDGFRAIWGEGPAMDVFTALALAGLVASFHGTIYAYARVLFALSRAGYFPRWISRTSGRHTPHLALVLGAAIGLGCTVAINRFAGMAVGAALLNMAVFGAVISYALVMASYIVLRVRRPDLPRPYRSPLGIPGAAAGAALSLVALAACFAEGTYRQAVWGVAGFLVIAVLYFFLYSRYRLVAQAPEEEAALVARAEEELAR